MKITDGLHPPKARRQGPVCGRRVALFVRCDYLAYHYGPCRFVRFVTVGRVQVRINVAPKAAR